MGRRRFLRSWILFSGIVISIIGLVHNSFAPGMYKSLLTIEPLKDKAPGFVYFFVFAGTAFLFAGLLTIYSSTGLKNADRWAVIIAVGSAIFVALGALSAVIFAKFENPLIYVTALCGVSNIILLSVFSPALKKGINAD